MRKYLQRGISFFKEETVLCVALVLAAVSSFVVLPDRQYVDYIDFRTLAILFSLMAVMAGLQQIGVFGWIAGRMLRYVRSVRSLVLVLMLLCFVSSMLITNDVALITFVPFSFTVFGLVGKELKEKLVIPVVVMQTIAANLGSMLTPIGNPQNLYLYSQSGMGLGEFIMLMLPYTVVSLALLVVWCLALGGKSGAGQKLQLGDAGAQSQIGGRSQLGDAGAQSQIGGRSQLGDIGAQSQVADRKLQSAVSGLEGASSRSGIRNLVIYLILFVLCLLTVARVLPYGLTLVLVIAAVMIADRHVLAKVDYGLLLTFVGFFVFIGNMGRIPAFSNFLASMMQGREVLTAVVSSQVISNVPAALLLSGFTGDYRALIVGTNLGGLGTLIASMASLISFKYVGKEFGGKKGAYLGYFTVANLVFLAVLLGCHFVAPAFLVK